MSIIVKGFSKLSKEEKIKFLEDHCFEGQENAGDLFKSFWHDNPKLQQTLDEFSENTLTNFPMPFGVVPNVIINNNAMVVPMVIEESSVVAACANSAKFWGSRGGFKADVLSVKKVGQVHFSSNLSFEDLKNIFDQNKDRLLNSVVPIVEKMEKRGGGILSFNLLDMSDELPDYYQLFLEVDTCDAMGANFINSILEKLGKEFTQTIHQQYPDDLNSCEIIMAILSNYTPECLVRAHVSCSVEELNDPSLGMSGEDFARRLKRAIDISRVDTYRATTHNKGIYNGVDAVIIASGNDFRAVEAAGHTYSCRDGRYRGLTHARIEDGVFSMWIDLPLSIGTVGGLTSLHPLSKLSLEMLGRPNAMQLMEITACIGLAQNFGALRSLVTSGIQKGHMKMHLMNILNQLNATDEEREAAKEFFKTETVSFNSTREFLEQRRNS